MEIDYTKINPETIEDPRLRKLARLKKKFSILAQIKAEKEKEEKIQFVSGEYITRNMRSYVTGII